MTWTIPFGTVACQRCTIDFAIALVLNDNRKYCESCLTIICSELIENKISPADINMKTFRGNREKSYLVDFKRIKAETWMSHLVLGGQSSAEILEEVFFIHFI